MMKIHQTKLLMIGDRTNSELDVECFSLYYKIV